MPYTSISWEDYEETNKYVSGQGYATPWDIEPILSEDGERVRYYSNWQGQFDLAEILTMEASPQGNDPALTFRTLQQLGVTQMRCPYDGGGDEGFALLEAVYLNGHWINRRDFRNQVADGPLGEVPAHITEDYDYERERLEEMPRSERVGWALDDLSNTLAYYLLGGGWGTGEVSITGTFIADLTTGQMTDLLDEE